MAKRIAEISDVAPCHQQTVNFGILNRGEVNGAISIVDHHFGGTRHSDAAIVSAAAASKTNFLTRPDDRANFDHRAIYGT